MSNPTDKSAGRPVDEESIGFLVARLSEQTSTLVRSEVELAKAEMAEKGKGLGVGIGAFGGAGILAFLGVEVLLAAAVLGLAEALPGWLAALVVALVVLAAAGIAAVVGKNKVAAATPPRPERAIAGIKEDVATVKDGITSGNGTNA